MLAKDLPQAFIGADGYEVANPRKPNPPHQGERPADLCIAQHGPVENIKNTFRFCRKTPEASRRFGSRKRAYCIDAFFRIGKQVEPLGFVPCVPRQRAGRFQRQIIVGLYACGFKDRIDDRTHGKNRGAGINARIAHL